MLHTFLERHRDAILTKADAIRTNRPRGLAPTHALPNGSALLLTQICDVLRVHPLTDADADAAIAASAAAHGRELMRLGFNVSQVVHDYGDICQAVTELASEWGEAITAGEFLILNRSLDIAIAEAVTEHARLVAESRNSAEVEWSGRLAHETRDLLNTALLAFEALRRGAVAANGNTALVLARSLAGLRQLVSNSLAHTRLNGEHTPNRACVPAAAFVSQMAEAAQLHADSRGIRFHVDVADTRSAIEVDEDLLGSAVMNLLGNAFKFTPSGGRVVLRSRSEAGRLRIEVEDECGGIPPGTSDLFRPFAEQRGRDRTGLGLGLSIAGRAVSAHGGAISIVNRPGSGCMFSIDLPLAGEAAVSST